MRTRVEQPLEQQQRVFRLLLVGSVVGLVLAYSALIAAKLVWGLPKHDWWRVALGPPGGFGLLVVPRWLELRQQRSEARPRDDLA